MFVRNRILHIGEVAATDLALRFGTPLYVYDAAVIRRQIENVRGAFTSMPLRPFYAMKANGNLDILRMFREAGFGCDCVSPGEIFLARHAGFDSDSIWFTCSNVSDADLRAIPDERIVVNVNSMSEIDRIVSLDLRNPVALRVNTDVGAGHHADVVTAGGSVKFGIDLAELGEARMIVEDSGRKIVGLHAHIGSGVDSPEPLLESARRLMDAAESFWNLKWINFGGGISVPYAPGEAEFPIADYGSQLAALTSGTLRARGMTAIVEPGRYLVAQAGTLLARATSKRISAGVEWVGVDSGFNHLQRPSKYDAYHHILNASNGSESSLRDRWDSEVRRDEVVVAGNICESGDVFTRRNGLPVARSIDPVHVGDLVAFCDAGAYGFSMASHYNARLLPAEVMVDGEAVRVIRAAQSDDDLLRGME